MLDRRLDLSRRRLRRSRLNRRLSRSLRSCVSLRLLRCRSLYRRSSFRRSLLCHCLHCSRRSSLHASSIKVR